MKSNLVWKDEKGGYVIVASSNEESGGDIRIRHRYGWFGSEDDIHLPLAALTAIISDISPLISREDRERLAVGLLQIPSRNLFYRDTKGKIRRFDRDPLERLLVSTTKT